MVLQMPKPEIDTAKGAKAAGALFGMSTYANKSVQDVQSAVGDSPVYAIISKQELGL